MEDTTVSQDIVPALKELTVWWESQKINQQLQSTMKPMILRGPGFEGAREERQ